jgi:hypothetical protein
MSLLAIAFVACSVGDITIEPVGQDLVPGVPGLPKDLPSPIPYDDGTMLPRPLDQAVSDLIGYCTDGYQSVVAESLAQTRRVERVACDGRLNVAESQWKANQVKDAIDKPSWTTWQVVGLSVGGVSVGILSGVVLGLALGR